MKIYINLLNFFQVLIKNFLGSQTNLYYKYIILFFIIINFFMFFLVSKFISGWLILIEFIFILIFSLQCYPFLPGGLILIQSIFMQIVQIKNIQEEINHNQEVIFLLIFMISSIKFLKKILLFIFTRILLSIKSKIFLSLFYFIISALFSAFLDAITVMFVIITVTKEIYNNYCDSIKNKLDFTIKKEIKIFRFFLRSLVMHAAVGSTLGGSITMIGEPQNIMIAKIMKWNFNDFFYKLSPITIPTFIFGIITTILLEKFKIFGYGYKIPKKINNFFINYKKNYLKQNYEIKVNLFIQSIILIWLIFAILFQVSEISLIGISIIIFTTSFCGINDEKKIGKSFSDSLTFLNLFILFLGITALINEQKLFETIIKFIFNIENNKLQIFWLYFFNGFLSAISDNIFVSSIFMNEVNNFFKNNLIEYKKFESLVIAIISGTNLPSIATPNGQAALLLLLTSSLTKLIKFSYKRIFIMLLPFTLIISTTGLLLNILLINKA